MASESAAVCGSVQSNQKIVATLLFVADRTAALPSNYYGAAHPKPERKARRIASRITSVGKPSPACSVSPRLRLRSALAEGAVLRGTASRAWLPSRYSRFGRRQLRGAYRSEEHTS